MLDFRVHTFIEVCRHMNFTRAAEKLNITQPTVSQHIRWLEREYGTELFRYEGRKLFLTEAGEQILSVAATMVHDEQFLRQQVRDAGRGRQLRLGATLTVGETLISGHVKAYMKKHPLDRITVEVGNTRRLTRMLDEGTIDFALVEGYFEKKEYDCEIYSSEQYVCICGPKTWERLTNGGKRTLKLTGLLNETLLVREEGSGTREILEKTLKDRNCAVEDFAGLIQISSIQAIKSLVQDDCGITFMYRRGAEEELASGTLMELRLQDVSVIHEFAFIWRKGSVFRETYREFFEPEGE